ncbi:family 43 glycosylhydrolase [Prevotella sp. E2-28]|uniref:family 43 glycosylhydrolase n=1 Tax=Prevotella sp. E2-28 TaxID=2913620 RepID=UPI001EDAD89F|nr:family 43 glycosylhydrolase [Prevotella sp. E2-28]UKK53684.1 family 43 glycosylhydrolase [Prevotella sp. E2-28]
MKQFFILLFGLLTGASAYAQTEVTTTEAKSLYKDVSKKRTSVHDPSVVYEPNSQRYYIFGSHRAQAYTTDLQNWTWFTSPWKVGSNNNASNDAAFVTPKVTKVKKGGVEVDLPAFNAKDWAARTDAGYSINGNMWAPDVIWNPVMQKWCQYLSVNGDGWHSSIILLTSDNIEGPYEYQAPVVISGFDNGSHSFKDTDVELVLGTMTTLPSRYNSPWAHTSKASLPNNIDPCVFYDEEGNLWMAYGSWSGGIFILELDEETGLRDYDVTYSTTNGDPYFGKRIAGGYYVSGEGAYIEYIGGYYYLFMSYGFLDQKGGYEMRVFRSKNPNGPYTDGGARNAVFDSYVLNYGPNAGARGEKLMGPYSHWGYMSQGERSQGHNSVIDAPDGRTYLIYHTRFCNDNKDENEGHQVRVHQLFQNKNGWLVASPFEYNGETITNEDIKTKQPFEKEQIIGNYSLLIHKFANNHNNLEQVEPVSITLNTDGTITGSKTGKWSIDEGTHYITLTLSNTNYFGVVYEETMDYTNMHAIAITAVTNGGISAWAYKLHPKYELAYQIKNQKLPVSYNQSIKKNVDLYGSMPLYGDHTTLQWTSSNPTVINDYGKYYPLGLEEDTEVTLTARLTCADYFWQESYPVKALSEANAKYATETWADGMLAHYEFDDEELTNKLNKSEKAVLKHNSTTASPIVDDTEQLRNGNTVHLNFGANGKESYVSMPNPLKGKDLSNGATISFFVKRTDDNLWDALLGMSDGTQRLYLTGNLYAGFNDGNGNYIDINHPETVKTDKLQPGKWNMVTITFSRTVNSTSGGITIYVNGNKNTDKYKESLNGKEATTKQGFDYNLILDLMASCDELYLGNGSFWGSADARFDDVMVYDRTLSYVEVIALQQMTDRSNINSKTDGILENVTIEKCKNENVYDLQGRRLENPRNGLYIKNGKKILVR